MEAADRSEARQEMDHVKGSRGDPSADAAPQEHCSNGQTPPGIPGGPYAPDEGAFETFVDGSGI
jgi:hypothetical protein